jgi:hypothetical protein
MLYVAVSFMRVTASMKSTVFWVAIVGTAMSSRNAHMVAHSQLTDRVSGFQRVRVSTNFIIEILDAEPCPCL